jgi:hypothetical protein
LIPVFVHVPGDEYIDSGFSEESLDRVNQWAAAWSKSYDSSIAEQARNVLDALDSFLKALDKKGRERAPQNSTGGAYLAGLLSQAEAAIADGATSIRIRKPGAKSRKKQR